MSNAKTVLSLVKPVNYVSWALILDMFWIEEVNGYRGAMLNPHLLNLFSCLKHFLHFFVRHLSTPCSTYSLQSKPQRRSTAWSVCDWRQNHSTDLSRCRIFFGDCDAADFKNLPEASNVRTLWTPWKGEEIKAFCLIDKMLHSLLTAVFSLCLK